MQKYDSRVHDNEVLYPARYGARSRCVTAKWRRFLFFAILPRSLNYNLFIFRITSMTAWQPAWDFSETRNVFRNAAFARDTGVTSGRYKGTKKQIIKCENSARWYTYDLYIVQKCHLSGQTSTEWCMRVINYRLSRALATVYWSSRCHWELSYSG